MMDNDEKIIWGSVAGLWLGIGCLFVSPIVGGVIIIGSMLTTFSAFLIAVKSA